MFHDIRLLTTAVYTDEYLVLQIKFAIGWLNQLEPYLTTAEVAARQGRRLDEGADAHSITFRPTCFGTSGPLLSTRQVAFGSTSLMPRRAVCPLRA